LTGKPAGKRPLAKPMPIWDDNIKAERDGTECETTTRTDLPPDRGRRQAVANIIIQIGAA
jgi:hypothetical protein